MGIFTKQPPSDATGVKAYRAHVQATQLRSKKSFEEAEKKFDEAFALYEQYVAEGGTGSKVLSAYAMLLMRKGEFKQARDLLMTSFKAPDATADTKAGIRIDYAVCLWKLGETGKACESVERAAQVGVSGPLFSTGGMIFIEHARKTGDFAKAIAFNERAYDYDEDDAGVLDNMGQLSMALAEKAEREGDRQTQQKELDKALDFEKRAHEANPTQVTSAYFYASLLLQKGKRDDAKIVLDRIKDVPISAISQITPEMVAALRAKIER